MTIDKLPNGWTCVKFGDVVRNCNENSRDLEAEGVERVVGLDHLDPGSLRLVRWDELAELPDGTTFTRKFRTSQVLFGKRRAYQRKVAVPNFAGVCSGDILVFDPADERMLADFLPYVVQSDGFFDHALGTSAGSLSPRTKWAELAKYEFALPPIDEQQRIVKLLKAADGHIGALREAISACASLSAASANAFVAADRDTTEVTLGSICDAQVGYAFPSAEYVDEGIPLIRCSNVGVRKIDWGSEITRFWSLERMGEVADYQLRSADVVVAMDRPFVSEGFKIARIAESDLPCLLLQRVCRLRVKGEWNPDLVWAILRSPATPRHLLSRQKGTDLPHITKADLESIPLNVSAARDPHLLEAFRQVERLLAELGDALSLTTIVRQQLLNELLDV
jgi:type I restriction enzyme S subunit